MHDVKILVMEKKLCGFIADILCSQRERVTWFNQNWPRLCFTGPYYVVLVTLNLQIKTGVYIKVMVSIYSSTKSFFSPLHITTLRKDLLVKHCWLLLLTFISICYLYVDWNPTRLHDRSQQLLESQQLKERSCLPPVHQILALFSFEMINFHRTPRPPPKRKKIKEIEIILNHKSSMSD